MSQPILSILIPTIPERKQLFQDLLLKLYAQRDKQRTYGHHVEILWNRSKKFRDGGQSIGAKRQSLLNIAEGKYLAFLDDDEEIAGNYLWTLIELCLQDKDVCTFKSFIQLDNYWGIVNMRLRYQNEQMHDEGETHRSPWHMCAIRSSIARQHKFNPDLNYGEDHDWVSRVLNDVRTEAHSDKIVHSYRHSVNVSEADRALAFQQSQQIQ